MAKFSFVSFREVSSRKSEIPECVSFSYFLLNISFLLHILKWWINIKLYLMHQYKQENKAAEGISKFFNYLWQKYTWLSAYFESSFKHGDTSLCLYISSVIRQKVESQRGCFKKTKHDRFSEKTNISYPLIRT